MSISPLRSPSLVTDDWDVRVAQQVTLQTNIETALDCADAWDCAGDARRALEWLDRASMLSGGLSPSCLAQRSRLVRALREQTH